MISSTIRIKDYLQALHTWGVSKYKLNINQKHCYGENEHLIVSTRNWTQRNLII